MPQLHMYVPEQVAKSLRDRARAKNMSISKYLAELVEREVVNDWPEGYFEGVLGRWQGVPLERPEQLELEERDPL